MNYYLMTHSHPPLTVYDEDKRIYYECLQNYDEAEELNPLCEFLKNETEKTLGKGAGSCRRHETKKQRLVGFYPRHVINRIIGKQRSSRKGWLF